MCKGKLTLNASVQNFLEETRDLHFKTETGFFVSENVNTILFRNFGFSLNYSFGRLKENVSKKKGVSNDEEVQ